MLILSATWLALVAWLIFRAYRQRDMLPAVTAFPWRGREAPDVALIVPARNERHNVGPCLRSLLEQEYPAQHLRIVVIDDDSTDGTAAIVRAWARHDRRITLLHTPPLPPGWKGKVNACWTGVGTVAPTVPWLCFIDADMRAHPQLIASAIAAATTGAIDCLSLAPRHDLETFAERLILPCGHYLLAFSRNLARVQAPNSPDAVASGQFMLIQRAAYDAAGGHAAVHGAICEDLELALRLKRLGYRVAMRDGTSLLSTRMYTGWDTLWPGLAKNLVDLLGGPAATAVTALIAVALGWAALALPVIDLIDGAGGSMSGSIAAALALLGSLAAFGLHLAGAAYFRIPIWYGLLFPLAYTAGAAIALDSLRWRLTRRVQWKGRIYP